jgi:hypothetical protein
MYSYAASQEESMSDRPTAVNGKRSQAWGTTSACPECGACLCFGCHPNGPCVDEHDRLAAPADMTPFAMDASGLGAWTFTPEGNLGVSGLHLRSR